MTEFVPFPKVYRLFRDCVITEKIDGTNSGITIERCDSCDEFGEPDTITITAWDTHDVHYTLTPQSRNRVLTVDSDNFGFARWVADNAHSLVADLGEGTHFGEWWGLGIQRGYDQDTKHFSLFNTTRWDDVEFITPELFVVPTLYTGNFNENAVRQSLYSLKTGGSFAAPGFTNPEGIVTYHRMSNTMFKTTIHGDDASKWEIEHASNS